MSLVVLIVWGWLNNWFVVLKSVWFFVIIIKFWYNLYSLFKLWFIIKVCWFKLFNCCWSLICSFFFKGVFNVENGLFNNR